VTQKIDGKDQDLVRGVTAQRWTFVIDKAGKIAHKETKVKAAEDSKAVLEAVAKVK
jgi:peroxiredoxin Q/BCP